MNIGIIGLGLIGGSLGRSIIRFTDNTVYGRDIDKELIIKAKLLKSINKELTEDDYKKLDMVFVATTPIIATGILDEICPKLKDGAIVMDCCGTKKVVINKMTELKDKYKNLYFLGGHPMAGREFSTISHSVSNLFDKAYFIVVPVKADIKILAKVKEFVISIGCLNMVITSREKHDQIISYTSELAHIVSSCYIKNPLYKEHVGYSAGSFRDMTRVAKLNPKMWTELMLENKENLIDQIDNIVSHLVEYRDALNNDDDKELYKLLDEGNILKEEADRLHRQGVIDD